MVNEVKFPVPASICLVILTSKYSLCLSLDPGLKKETENGSPPVTSNVYEDPS